MKSKILVIGIGSLLALGVPTALVVACGSSDSETNSQANDLKQANDLTRGFTDNLDLNYDLIGSLNGSVIQEWEGWDIIPYLADGTPLTDSSQISSGDRYYLELQLQANYARSNINPYITQLIPNLRYRSKTFTL